jgi:ABC-type sugar transport system permease subunit
MAQPSLADERTRSSASRKLINSDVLRHPGALAVFAVFVGYPIVFTVYLSFFDWNGMAPEKTSSGCRTIAICCSATNISTRHCSTM